MAADGDEALLINPETLNPGEEVIVADLGFVELGWEEVLHRPFVSRARS